MAAQRRNWRQKSSGIRITPKMRDALLSAGMKDVASETSKRLAADDARAKEILKCGTPDAAPGCDVTVRYLYQVLRGLPHEIVFAQILLGFELASSDPRFVGLNLVMPEDWYVPHPRFQRAHGDDRLSCTAFIPRCTSRCTRANSPWAWCRRKI